MISVVSFKIQITYYIKDKLSFLWSLKIEHSITYMFSTVFEFLFAPLPARRKQPDFVYSPCQTQRTRYLLLLFFLGQICLPIKKKLQVISGALFRQYSN